MSSGSEDYNLLPAPARARRPVAGSEIAKLGFPKPQESACWGSKRIASQVLFETLLRSG
jgi:hypothetical protein